MLAAIVNAMLDRIERLMHRSRCVRQHCPLTCIAPLTRLRGAVVPDSTASGRGSPEALQLDEVIGETDTLMARFRGLLRISELEDRPAFGFLAVRTVGLYFRNCTTFTCLAEEGHVTLILDTPSTLPSLTGDRALLFEALASLLSNSIQVHPAGRRSRVAGDR